MPWPSVLTSIISLSNLLEDYNTLVFQYLASEIISLSNLLEDYNT